MVEPSADDACTSDANALGHPWVGRLAGLLIGCLSGMVATLLLAPRSGKRTRAKLRRIGSILVEQAAVTVENAVALAREASDRITHDVREQASDLKQRGLAMLDRH